MLRTQHWTPSNTHSQTSFEEQWDDPEDGSDSVYVRTLWGFYHGAEIASEDLEAVRAQVLAECAAIIAQQQAVER